MDSDQEILRSCAWCGRIDTGAGWILPSTPPPNLVPLTHTICPDCLDDLREHPRLPEG